jgi:two-component system, NtrC family, sensor kinase
MRDSLSIADRLRGADDAVARFEALFADAPVAFQVFGADGHCEYCNPAFRDLFGSEPPPEYNLLHDDIAARRGYLEQIRRAFGGEVVRVAPVWYDARDLEQINVREGRLIAVEAVVLPLTDYGGIVRHVAVIFNDKTAELETRDQTGTRLRVIAESSETAAKDAVRRAQHDLRQVIECSPDGIAVTRMGRLVYLNNALARTLGFDRTADLLGQDIQQFVHPDDLPEVLQQIRGLGAGAVQTEVRYRRQDGRYVPMELSLARLSDFDGAPAMIGIMRDLGARKKLHAQQLMSDRLASLGTLAAGAAHEINNPLASLITNLNAAVNMLSSPPHEAGTVAVETDRTDGVLECLRDANEAADRIRQVVGDLRLFSRIDQEQSVAVDLCSTLDSSIRLVNTEIRHRARLVKDYVQSLVVHGTEVRLGQVFLNLLINAAQAIPEGRPDKHEIRISVRAQGSEHVVVEVEDTGVGIAPEIRARIFEPFFTTKATSKGTGLGLAICQKIVTEYGGHIDVQSEVGNGSVFRVTLRRWHEKA